jgi:hypothetical protein
VYFGWEKARDIAAMSRKSPTRPHRSKNGIFYSSGFHPLGRFEVLRWGWHTLVFYAPGFPPSPGRALPTQTEIFTVGGFVCVAADIDADRDLESH